MTRHLSYLPDGKFERRRVAASAAPADTALPDELVIPDDLSGTGTDDLRALHDQAVEVFNAIYGDGTGDLTDEEFAALSAVTEGVERLRTELDARDQAAAERQNSLAELAGRVNGSDDSGQGDTEGGDAEGGDDAEGEAEGGTEGSEFSSRTRIPLSSLRSRARSNRPAPRQQDGPQGMRDLVTAAADLPGYSNGQSMDWADLGRALDRRLTGFNSAQYLAASRSGRSMRQQFGVAAIRRPMPADLMITGNDPAHVDDVIRRATDQSRLPGGSLVAAGGWCAPSEIMYDLLELESGDGIVSVPEIGISRGGIQFTTGPDFSAIYAGTGFTYSEAQDFAASYSGGTNEVQSLTTSGVPTGGTFVLAFDGIDLPPLNWNATAAQVQAAIQSVTGANTVTCTGGPLPTAVSITFDGIEGYINVPQLTVVTNSLTGGTTPAPAVSTTTPGVAGTGGKPTYFVPCPGFTEERLNLMGVSISAGLLQQRGYPEVLARTIRGALIAHEHRMAAAVIADMVSGSTPVTVAAPAGGTTGLVLAAIELQAEHYRYAHRMPRNTTLEAVFPHWAYGAIRLDLSKRLYVDYLSVTDAQISAWFAQRGISAQFVYNWQDITGTADTFTSWPASLSFLMYAAGTWVKGVSDIISLDTVYDSVNLAQNDFTALFTEEGWLVAKRGFDSRVVTVATTGTAGA